MTGWDLHKDARGREFEFQPRFCPWSGQPGARLQLLRGRGSEEGAPLESARVLSGLAATLPLPLAENSYRTLSPQKNAPVWVHIHFRFSFRALPGWPSTVPGTQQELRARLWTG